MRGNLAVNTLVGTEGGEFVSSLFSCINPRDLSSVPIPI